MFVIFTNRNNFQSLTRDFLFDGLCNYKEWLGFTHLLLDWRRYTLLQNLIAPFGTQIAQLIMNINFYEVLF